MCVKVLQIDDAAKKTHSHELDNGLQLQKNAQQLTVIVVMQLGHTAKVRVIKAFLGTQPCLRI